MGNEFSEGESSELEILTCSAGDYAAMQGKNLNVYEAVGLYAADSDYDDCVSALRVIAEDKGCEAIVDAKYLFTPGWMEGQYDHSTSKNHFTATGLRVKKIEP